MLSLRSWSLLGAGPRARLASRAAAWLATSRPWPGARARQMLGAALSSPDGSLPPRARRSRTLKRTLLSTGVARGA
eukprot:15431747-Alexandrium_andersonii.AAC.1